MADDLKDIFITREEHYLDKGKLYKHMNEIDARHTGSIHKLEKMMIGQNETNKHLVKGFDDMKNELVKLNDNFTLQSKEVLHVKHQVSKNTDAIEKDREEFDDYKKAAPKEIGKLIKEATEKKKNNKSMVVSVITALGGGTGIAYLIAEIFK